MVTKMIGTPKIWEHSFHGVSFSIWRAFSIERKPHVKFWLVDQKGKRTMTSCKKCIHSYPIPVSVVDINSCAIHYQVNLLVLLVFKMVSKPDVVSSKPLRGMLPPSACLLGSEFKWLSFEGGCWYKFLCRSLIGKLFGVAGYQEVLPQRTLDMLPRNQEQWDITEI